MNENNSKKIFFNKSTLLSLKAELLKKQEEVKEKKQLPQHKVENFKPAPAKVTDNDQLNKDDNKCLKYKLFAVDTEELEACRKTKLALEKKAELYEHLSDRTGNSELASRFLVDFNTKKQQDEENDVSNTLPTLQEPQSTSQDEWEEFTDCLGRTRKCHKSDLEWYKQKDLELMKVMVKGNASNKDDNVSEDSTKTEKTVLVQKTEDYLQSLRKKWDAKEQELLAKDKDIHYQDLLFDEARIHGVGYLSFSTDETERRKQLEELKKTREETILKQEEAEKARKKRDELMAARVAAARARQRARAGLPPEQTQENTDDFTTRLLEFLTQQKDEADAKAKEEEKKQKEEQERERQKLRDAYVREWDIGKSGVDGDKKKFREMSQEEYVEEQRNKRIDEFAPSHNSSSDNFNHTFDDKGRFISDKPEQSKTWSDVRPRLNILPPPGIGEVITESEEKGLYFSSVKKDLKYKNFVKSDEPMPIVNLIEDESDTFNEKGMKRMYETNEVAPPPTFEYYGPVSKNKKSKKPFESDIREAFAQGAKSLEPKSSKRQLSKNYDFTFD